MSESKVAVFLLRGINLGAHNRISMPQLLESAATVNISDAATVQQTGNLAGRLSASDLRNVAQVAGDLRSALKDQLNLDVPVLGIDGNTFRRIVAAQPYREYVAKLLHVVFLAGQPSAEQFGVLTGADFGLDHCTPGDRSLYVNYAEAVHTSKLTLAKIERALGTDATARNINTSRALADLVDSLL